MAARAQSFPGGDAYFAMGMAKEPKLNLQIEKRDNGYVVDLYEPPKKEKPKPPVMPTEAEIDEKLDAIADGFAAFMRSIYDKAAGEDWKEDEAKEKIRAAIKAFAPSIASPGEFRMPPMPRTEQNVFEKKADLLKYLEANL